MNKADLIGLLNNAREGYLFDFSNSDDSLIFTKSPAGDSLLHVAAARGNIKEIDFLLANGLEINARGDYGATPLHCAAMTGQREAYQHLLRCGADPTVKDLFGALASDSLETESNNGSQQNSGSQPQ